MSVSRRPTAESRCRRHGCRPLPGRLGASPAEVKQKIERPRGRYAGLGVAPDQFGARFVGNGNEIRRILVAAVLVAGTGEPAGKPGQPPAALAGQPDTRSTAVFGKRLAQLTCADGLEAAEPDYRKVSGTRYAVACGDQPTKTAGWHQRLSDRRAAVPDLRLGLRADRAVWVLARPAPAGPGRASPPWAATRASTAWSTFS
jgi:hypothetical protein